VQVSTWLLYGSARFHLGHCQIAWRKRSNGTQLSTSAQLRDTFAQ
jgi:hypothetical protein